MSKKINIEDQWKFYLNLVNVKEESIPIAQASEMKRSFYGAFGQFLIIGKEVLSLMTEEQQTETLRDLMRQVGEFWKNEGEKHKIQSN